MSRLHIPGPVEVSPKTYAAMARPMIGHRSAAFQELYRSIHEPLQKLFGTSQPVFLSTSSAWGVMEAAVRNLAQRKVLNCCSGAFSDKWFQVSQSCGIDAQALSAEWGQPIDPRAVRQALESGHFDALTLVHNETSTGTLNPLPEIAAVVRDFPDVSFIVDTVSSFSAMPISMDALGIDVMLTGSQKALALPPGLALFSLSEKALAKAETTPARGYYFDFLEFHKNWEKWMTPSTPTISLLYALQSKLEDIAAEGLEARYTRHAALNAMVHQWVRENDFAFFAPEGYRSLSLTCVANNRQIDVAALKDRLLEKHGLLIDGGYGKIKGSTFRLSNMGDETPETIANLLSALSQELPS